MKLIQNIKLTQKAYINDWIPISLILIVGAVLYFFKIDSFPLETDELYSVYDAKELKIFYYRPFYFILLNIWMHLSTDEGWLRSLAVLFGLGSIFLTYQLGRRLSGETIGLISAILIALSPMLIGSAQQVRMYTLGNFLTLAGSLALTYVLEKTTAKMIAFWAVSRFLSLLTIPLSVTILVPDFILIVTGLRKQHDKLFKVLASLLGIAILWIPFAILLVTTKSYYESTWGEDTSPPSIIQVVRNLKFFTFWPGRVPSNQLLSNFHRVFTAVLALLLGIALFRKHRNSQLLWLAAWLFLPLLSLILISNFHSLELLPRYLVFTAPFLFILLTAGFIKVWQSQRTFGIVLTIGYFIAVGSGVINHYSDSSVADWRGANLEISRNEQPQDAIAVSIPHGRVCPFITHYYQGNIPIYGLSQLRGEVTEQELDDFVQSLPTSQPRTWLLFRKAFKGTFKDLEVALSKKYSILQQQAFSGGIKVFLLEARLLNSQLQSAVPSQFSVTALNCVRTPQVLLFKSLDEKS